MSAPDLAKLSTVELISLRFRSISDLDYEMASAIDAHLLRSREMASTHAISALFTDLVPEVNRAIQVYQEDCTKTGNFYRHRVFDVRIATDDAFQECQRRHLEELDAIEKEYAFLVLREERRPVREQIELIAYSRRLALAGEYAQSIEIRQAAKEALKPELARRRAAADARFDKIRQIAFARQKVDLDILNTKLVGDLNQIETDKVAEMERQKRRFIVAIRTLKTRAVTKGMAVALSKERKVEVAAAINGFVDDRVRDLTGILIDVTWSLAARQRREAGLESKAGYPASPSRGGIGGSPRKSRQPPDSEEEESG
jgi:hypothetical protein